MATNRSTHPQGADIEIIERRASARDGFSGEIVVPNEVRVNGVSMAIPYGAQIAVHEVSSDQPAQVTITMYARRVLIAAEEPEEADA